MYYSTGLKGVDPRKVQDAEMLIFETLADLAEDGHRPRRRGAAVNSVEFSYRENNSGRFPRGLSAMIQALSTWLYDGDPLAPLAWEGRWRNQGPSGRRGEGLRERHPRPLPQQRTPRHRGAAA